MDAANLDYDDAADDRPDVADAYVQASALPAPFLETDAVASRHVDDGAMMVSNWALEHIQNLENQVRELTERNHAVYDELHVLRHLHDNHIETIGRLNRDLLQYQGVDPNGIDLYTTAATGRTWHRNRNCHHLRNTRVRNMRCCADCGR